MTVHFACPVGDIGDDPFVADPCTAGYRAPVAAMVSPARRWRVEVVTYRGGRRSFKIHQSMRVGRSERGWRSTGQLRATVAEGQALLGDAFADLADVFDGTRDDD